MEHWASDFESIYNVSRLDELVLPVEIGYDHCDSVKGNPKYKWQYFNTTVYLPSSGTAIVSVAEFDVADFYARLIVENMDVMAEMAKTIFQKKIAVGEVLSAGWLFGVPHDYGYLNMLVPLYMAKYGASIDALEGEIYTMRQTAYEDICGVVYQDMDLWMALVTAQIRYTSLLAHMHGKQLLISETNLDGRWRAHPDDSCYSQTELKLAVETFLTCGADFVVVFEIDPDDNYNPWSTRLNHVTDGKSGLWEPLPALVELSNIACDTQKYAAAKTFEIEPTALLMPFETDLAAWMAIGGDHRAIMGILASNTNNTSLVPMPIEAAYELRDKIKGLIVMSIYGRGLATTYELKLLNDVVTSGVPTLVLGRVSPSTTTGREELWITSSVESPLNLTEYVLLNITIENTPLTLGLSGVYPVYSMKMFGDEVMWQATEDGMVQGKRVVGKGTIYYVGVSVDMWQSWSVHKQQVKDRWAVIIDNFLSML